MSQRVRQSVSPGHASYQVTGCFVKVPLPPTPFSYRRERERKVETKEIHLGQAPSNPPRELSVIRSCVFWKDINTWMHLDAPGWKDINTWMHLTLHQPPISICFPIGEQSTVTVLRQRKRWERALSLLIFETFDLL